ncbi:MAG TPA: VCBS repeat-containing protein [Anaerolineales bacterium]|nr:VCBS repeat-containing protein [Anaerolineales bacterium]
MTYLNSGGTLAQLEKSPPFSGEIKDLTGDGVSEVVLRGLVRYDILSCKDGKYQNLFQFFTYDFSIDLGDIFDLNKDGIPEIIFYSFSRYGYANIYIIEWDGIKFRSLIDAGTDEWTGAVIDSIPATTDHKLVDTNGDGLKEIVVVYDTKEMCCGFGGFDFYNGAPARKQTTILGWNGQNYVDLKQENYAPPQYRFQAIQDGDWHTRYGNYAKALSLYREAIFNDQLEWWSPEREVYEVRTYESQFDSTPAVYPTAILDNTEYPRLAAYAYYRIMPLHIVQAHGSDANTVYKTLQQKFGNDPYGRPYVEMATTFWEAYQSAHKMYDGCAAAIQYAVEHSEILIPLGSDYHGSQSHIYVPADVCPFR